MITELRTVYDPRKSFYGKARVEFKEDGTRVLWSYDTAVAQIKDSKAAIFGFHSPTTLRHIKEFLYQNNFEIGTKEQLRKMY